MIDFKLLIEKALKLGFSDVEIVEKSSKALEVSLFRSVVDQNVLSEDNSISIRAMYNDKMANMSIENFDCDLDEVLNRLKANVLTIEAEEKNEIYAGSESYPTVEKNEYDFDAIPTSKKIELLLQLEEKCKQKDSRIIAVSNCFYEESDSKYHIINSKGLDIVKYNRYCVAGVGVVARDNGDTQNAYQFSAKKSFEEIDIDEISNKAVEKAIAKFNAKPVKTDKYKVIFDKDAMSSLLGAYLSMFTGIAGMKKITPLLGKENEKIMSEKISIIDNPLYKGAIINQPFDDEGVACFTKEVVKDGVLKTLLHNLKTAKFFNTKSTGNGFASQRGISISGCNFYIEKGTKSKEELISSLDKGLLITGLDGLHAGVDAISGDFSVKANGFYIENGKINRAVTLIVISGNFLQMMNDVIEVANDLEITYKTVVSPSILFNDLSISGE